MSVLIYVAGLSANVYLTPHKQYVKISLSFYQLFSNLLSAGCFIDSEVVRLQQHLLTNVLKYNVAPLLKPEVGATLSLDVHEENQTLGDLKVDYVRGLLRLTRTNRRILAKGVIETALEAECVRCLTPFRLSLKIPLEEMFALSPAADPVYFIDESWLDLRQPLREQIMLAMPIHSLCRPNCKGLCSNCGQNLNEGPCNCSVEDLDPRLAALKSLL